MASIKEKTDAKGRTVYQVQASDGRGRRVWRTFRPEPTWSAKTTRRELRKFAAQLETELKGGQALTKAERHEEPAARPPRPQRCRPFASM